MIRDPESFKILVGTVERFVRERLIPREAEVVETDAIPEDIVAEMRRMGLFGLTIPEEYGGLGLTMEEEVRVAMAMCKASPAFRSIIGTNLGIGSVGIVLDGIPEPLAGMALPLGAAMWFAGVNVVFRDRGDHEVVAAGLGAEARGVVAAQKVELHLGRRAGVET